MVGKGIGSCPKKGEGGAEGYWTAAASSFFLGFLFFFRAWSVVGSPT
jgi:hypothetical protein